MSVLGQMRTFQQVRVMSALPPKADIDLVDGDVRYVPKADILRSSKRTPLFDHFVGRDSSDCGTDMPSAFAVLRFMNSILVGNSIGRSASFAPLRILSTR